MSFAGIKRFYGVKRSLPADSTPSFMCHDVKIHLTVNLCNPDSCLVRSTGKDFLSFHVCHPTYLSCYYYIILVFSLVSYFWFFTFRSFSHLVKRIYCRVCLVCDSVTPFHKNNSARLALMVMKQNRAVRVRKIIFDSRHLELQGRQKRLELDWQDRLTYHLQYVILDIHNMAAFCNVFVFSVSDVKRNYAKRAIPVVIICSDQPLFACVLSWRSHSAP